MPIRTRTLYSSANGDRWLLCLDTHAERVFVRHEPNAPSGGQVAEIEIGTFLSRGPLTRISHTTVGNEGQGRSIRVLRVRAFGHTSGESRRAQ